MINAKRLQPEDLTHKCDPDCLGFDTTRELEPLSGTVGQERAVSALSFGLEIETQGFNIYVAGRPGTGRNSAVKAHVNMKAKDEPRPDDWCYVNNFEDPYHPTAIRLSSGRGPEFEQDMEEFVKTARNELPRAFESENYEKRKNEVLESVQHKREQLLNELQQEATDLGFSIEATPVGIATVPLNREGKPYSREDYDALPEDIKQDIRQRGTRLQESTNAFVSKSRALEKEAQDKLHDLDREIALFAVGHLLQDLRAKYQVCDGMGDCEAILNYLNAVENDVVEHLDDFRLPDKRQQPMQQPIPPMVEEMIESAFDRYKVNVFVSYKDCNGAPVVFENNPTYNNLLGRIEYKSKWGFMSTDHNMIKAGAIHRANGGYLILQALDVLTNPFSWDALKRFLRAQEGAPESLADQYGVISIATLRPQPIPLDVKVIMVGSPYIYYLLYYLDDEFRKLFKVKADFDIEMRRNDMHIAQYAAFITSRVKELDLLPFDKAAVAAVVDYGSRIIEDKDRLSTRFIEISDLVSEATYWAKKDGSDVVSAHHVNHALEQKEYRSRMIEDKIQSLIEEGVLMIDTSGSVVGQANALSIYDLGDYSFGRPSRVTARISAGRGKIVDLQRESEMGGRIHSKGMLILAGYLQGKYAEDKPLAVTATVGFEQLYEEVEGDSASSTELYVLLSALAGLPVNQEIAVTGSVNQFGQVQPIGGVNRKIEGFFEVCKAKGLTGNQGVMIPISNVRHLMLKQEVIDAVNDGKFNIWAIENVDQGIEILTGVPAGEEMPQGGYPEGTVHFLVNQRLQSFADTAKEFAAVQPPAAPEVEKEPAASVQPAQQTLKISHNIDRILGR